MLYPLKLTKKTKRFIDFTLLQLLQHNVQLGSAVKFSLLSSHWFVYGVRQQLVIINLSQTILQYRYFLDLIRAAVTSRRHILFVNERRYTRTIVSDVALSVGEAYIMGRWVGGSMTNFKKLWIMYHSLLKYKSDLTLSRFKLNLKNSLKGLTVLKSLPSVVFFNSIKHNHSATGETFALHIPSAGITDSDALPDSVLYAVPGNDDAFGSVLFLNTLIAKVVLITKIETMLKLYNEFCTNLLRWAARLARRKLRQKNKHFPRRAGRWARNTHNNSPNFQPEPRNR